MADVRMLVQRLSRGGVEVLAGATSPDAQGDCWSVWWVEHEYPQISQHYDTTSCDEYILVRVAQCVDAGWVIGPRSVVLDGVDDPPPASGDDAAQRWTRRAMGPVLKEVWDERQASGVPYVPPYLVKMEFTLTEPSSDLLDLLSGGAL